MSLHLPRTPPTPLSIVHTIFFFFFFFVQVTQISIRSWILKLCMKAGLQEGTNIFAISWSL